MFARRKNRNQLSDEVRDICRELGLQCEIRVRCGPLTGGLMVDVTGPAEQLDAYGDRHVAMLAQFIDDAMASRGRTLGDGPGLSR